MRTRTFTIELRVPLTLTPMPALWKALDMFMARIAAVSIIASEILSMVSIILREDKVMGRLTNSMDWERRKCRLNDVWVSLNGVRVVSVQAEFFV